MRRTLRLPRRDGGCGGCTGGGSGAPDNAVAAPGTPPAAPAQVPPVRISMTNSIMLGTVAGRTVSVGASKKNGQKEAKV